ncbi:MAG: hypothetical protein KAR62_02245, partial [Sphingomonadales bacterium]|nr:hypothetical protein [Sphingomonadales bacterium]
MATLKIIKSAKPVLAMFAMLVFTGFYTPATAQDQAQDTAQEQAFDLSHAREALQYFAKPSRTNISHVAFSAPARKLAQFYNSNSSDGSEGGSTDKSTFEITQILLNHMPNTNQLDHVKALITMIADNEEKQNQCMANALAHLPQNQIENPLYIVWADGIWANGLLNGKDNIINIANASMLDITNEQYIAQPQDIWTDCIHALHHAGMNKINPIPFSLDGISLSDELLAYIEHTTLLEGSAHYASNPDAVAAITLAKTT